MRRNWNGKSYSVTLTLTHEGYERDLSDPVSSIYVHLYPGGPVSLLWMLRYALGVAMLPALGSIVKRESIKIRLSLSAKKNTNNN
jgi:hypothetical protein